MDGESMTRDLRFKAEVTWAVWEEGEKWMFREGRSLCGNLILCGYFPCGALGYGSNKLLKMTKLVC